jgi:hypothetical protein
LPAAPAGIPTDDFARPHPGHGRSRRAFRPNSVFDSTSFRVDCRLAAAATSTLMGEARSPRVSRRCRLTVVRGRQRLPVVDVPQLPEVASMPRSRIAVLVAAALVLGACSDNAPITGPRVSTTPLFDASPLTPRHIMETRDAAKPGSAGRKSSGTGIYYHGGPLLTAATNVAAVFWASGTIYSGGPTAGSTGTGLQDGSLVGYFLNHLGGSAYFNINTTYYDGSNTYVKNVVNYTQFWANNSYNVPSGSQSVSDSQIAAMLQYAFNNNKLTYDRNTLYAVFTAGTVNLGGGFGTQYCAYHTHATITVNGLGSVTVLYAAMPYNYAYPSACTNGTAAPNGDPGADAEVNTLAHEVEETTTDQMGNAWYDRIGYENADKCAWNFGATSNNGTGVYNIVVGSKDFLVQQNWINTGSGGCRQGY